MELADHLGGDQSGGSGSHSRTPRWLTRWLETRNSAAEGAPGSPRRLGVVVNHAGYSSLLGSGEQRRLWHRYALALTLAVTVAVVATVSSGVHKPWDAAAWKSLRAPFQKFDRGAGFDGAPAEGRGLIQPSLEVVQSVPHSLPPAEREQAFPANNAWGMSSQVPAFGPGREPPVSSLTPSPAPATVPPNLQPAAQTPAPAPETTTRPTPPPPTPAPVPVSKAPLLEFYTYRAVPDDAFTKFPFGNTNTGNPDGVMWYLTNEVVTMYTSGVRCPRKFNITKIIRLKIRSKATPELFNEGMNFGARFAYDFGKCSGRCFNGNKCTGEADCEVHYNSHGYVVGCNHFYDRSVFPDFQTPAPNGIWYTFPIEGKCDFPTGAHDCTWSAEEAGEVTLQEMEETFPTPPNVGNCCYGRCTSYWDDVVNPGKTSWRVQQLVLKFKQKYPEMPELGASPCDFNKGKWYAVDDWPRRDPWAKEKDPEPKAVWPGQARR